MLFLLRHFIKFGQLNLAQLHCLSNSMGKTNAGKHSVSIAEFVPFID